MSADGELMQTTKDVRYELLRALDPDQEDCSPRELFIKLSDAANIMESALAVRDREIWGTNDEDTPEGAEERWVAEQYMTRHTKFFGEQPTASDLGGDGSNDLATD